MKPDWRRGILYAAVIGMEGGWLYTLMTLLNQSAAGGRLAVFGLLLLYPVSAVLGSRLRRLRCPEVIRRVISWLAWAAGLLLIVKIQLFGNSAWSDTDWLMAIPRAMAEVLYTFKPELLMLISTAVIWWLGRRLAYLRVGFTALVSEFQFGLAILVATFFIASLLELEIAHAIYLIAAFFLLALSGISVAHALEGTGWLAGRSRGHWAGLLLVSIGLVLVAGFLISLAVTPDLLRLVLDALKWVWGLIVKVLVFIASLFPEPEPADMPPAAPASGTGVPEESTRWFVLPEALRNGLRLGWTLLFLGFILLALWRISSDILRWYRRRMASMSGAEFESLTGAFRADFLNFFKRIFSRLLGLGRRLRPGAGAKALPPEIASVRQIYRQLLRWAAAAGFPRQTYQTPHEYLYELADRLPETRGDLELITQQYVRTRYGARLLTEGELHRLRQSWYNVKQSHRGDRRQA